MFDDLGLCEAGRAVRLVRPDHCIGYRDGSHDFARWERHLSGLISTLG